jgi:hypothetical protein
MAVIKGGRPAYYPGRVILFRSEDPEWDKLNKQTSGRISLLNRAQRHPG